MRDEAASKAEEECALRMAKEREEEENRRREMEERAKTQAEIDALKTVSELAYVPSSQKATVKAN